jgi:hypothetical protein
MAKRKSMAMKNRFKRAAKKMRTREKILQQLRSPKNTPKKYMTLLRKLDKVEGV